MGSRSGTPPVSKERDNPTASFPPARPRGRDEVRRGRGARAAKAAAFGRGGPAATRAKGRDLIKLTPPMFYAFDFLRCLCAHYLLRQISNERRTRRIRRGARTPESILFHSLVRSLLHGLVE
ncbi:hypothetical protein EVAR_92639_1 [Eumeta japonica]|uniref:Uncharacterized protein n=1 Tax=Eumeta variegata TaxID=151549 RepID=A0A4C1SXL1_EUMVA|nr:hypothetical protein EVAR_92639_1 [Eumeta japonica]